MYNTYNQDNPTQNWKPRAEMLTLDASWEPQQQPHAQQQAIRRAVWVGEEYGYGYQEVEVGGGGEETDPDP